MRTYYRQALPGAIQEEISDEENKEDISSKTITEGQSEGEKNPEDELY